MPNISMCANHDCPSRVTCYRYRAVPDTHWQSYAYFTPDKGDAQCQHYLPLRLNQQGITPPPASERGKTLKLEDI